SGYLGNWVGLANYKRLFTTSTLETAIKNNAIWVAVVPAFVTAIGLMFAVLIEKIRWSVAFKTCVFLPMAISAFATGVTWRLMYQQDPSQGALNALGRVVHDAVSPPGVLSSASPSVATVQTLGSGALVLRTPLRPGGVARLGLTAIPPDQVPAGAKQAVLPASKPGTIRGVVWRDFKPGGGVPGKVEKGELGLPGVSVQLQDLKGHTVQSASTASDGTFEFSNVSPGTYRTAIGAQTFARPWGGISWLGPSLITPALLIAYVWIWAGFAMVVIAAGLSSMPRDVLEAARTDGATEFQVFRRVTVPLLAPVLTVVLITMVINVLKVFDLVLALAPESTQSNANVIALAMWRTAFTADDFGLGSAIAVFLFVLVVPVLLLNVRRFRREV
ncbi:MAG TPA: ABC transporter permease subunit, partial [Gaiellaceae bacterium]|nr:ABC transporter permease subunit [Gaiellaceae bacterium]